jgi:hypothetical protein
MATSAMPVPITRPAILVERRMELEVKRACWIPKFSSAFPAIADADTFRLAMETDGPDSTLCESCIKRVTAANAEVHFGLDFLSVFVGVGLGRKECESVGK